MPMKYRGLSAGSMGAVTRESFEHLLPRLSDREPADSVTREAELDRAGQALLPQVGIEPPLHDAEQRLIGPPMRLFATRGPARRPPQGLFVVLTVGVSGRALVQNHRDVSPELLLYLRDQLGCEGVERAVVDGGELDALLRDASRPGQGEHLVATRVGEHRAVPPRERVQPTGLPHEIRARPQVEVVGIAEHDARSNRPQVTRRKPLDRPLRPHGHEGRRLDLAVWCSQYASPRLAVARDDLYGYRRPYRRLPPFRINIASPNE